MRIKSWTEDELRHAVKNSYSYRQVLIKLGLKEAGGNYSQIKKYINEYKLKTSHFRGKLWNKGLNIPFKPRKKLNDILVKNSSYQSYKLKKRLIDEGIKQNKCEICSWAERSIDGRIPLELDHINGDAKDNRLLNLRVLCPNCHSLQITHRGKNIKK
jgi:thymidylate synthase ThyX